MTFQQNFQSILTATTDNAIYTDIKKMYEEQIIDNKMFKELMLSFQKEVFSNAIAYAKEVEFSQKTVEIDEVDAEGNKKKISLQEAQILIELEKLNTEKERTDLLKLQKTGFYDNRVIALNENMRGMIGEIQGSGNESPQQLWDLWFHSGVAMATIASNHPDIPGVIPVPATPPTAKTT